MTNKKKRSKEINKLRYRKRLADPTKKALINKNRRKKYLRKKKNNIEKKITSENKKNTIENINSAMHNVLPTVVVNYNTLCLKYESDIKEGPIYACCCCGLLKFRKSLIRFNKEKYFKFGETFLNKIFQKDTNSELICNTCAGYIRKGQVPILCLANGLQFPTISSTINKLTTLEERLVCTRLPFLRITSLGVDRQKGLRGNIVNVPITTDNTVSVLPRTFTNSEIVQLNLVRRMSDNHSYMYETVRPKIVMLALKELINTQLYVEEGVTMSDSWYDDCKENIDFVVDNADLKVKASKNIIIHNSEIDSDDEIINPGGHETLILDQNEILDIKIAPAEGFLFIFFLFYYLHFLQKIVIFLGKTPLGLLMDDRAECLSFPKIYGGNMRKPSVKISYSKIAKSELMRYHIKLYSLFSF